MLVVGSPTATFLRHDSGLEIEHLRKMGPTGIEPVISTALMKPRENLWPFSRVFGVRKTKPKSLVRVAS